MPAPTYTAGTLGNLFSGVSLAHGANYAAYLDAHNIMETRVTARIATGGSPPTAGTVFGSYLIEGADPTTTVSSFTNSTTVVVASATNLLAGQQVAFISASTGVGEVATISSISTNTLTVSTLVNTYTSSDKVYLFATIPAGSVMPASSTGTWAASKSYSATLFVGEGKWLIVATNNDGSATVTATSTQEQTPGFA